MKLNKMCKRVLSVTLAAALTLGSPIALKSTGVVDPKTAKAAEATLPTPIYENDFEAPDANDGDLGKIRGGGSIQLTDTDHKKVFQNAPDGGDVKRHNYYQLPSGVFADNLSKISENKGVTISFAVKNPTESDNYLYYPAFTAYADDSNGADNTFPMLAVQARGLLQYNSAAWNDFDPVENVKNNGTNVENNSLTLTSNTKWHIVTAVISERYGYFYLDGKVINKWDVSLANRDGEAKDNKTFLDTGIGLLKHICLGGNQAWGYGDDDSPYMFDDVKIYAEALTQEQIIMLLPKTDRITITPQNETISGTAYYVSTEDNIVRQDSGEQTVNATIVPVTTADAPKLDDPELLDWSVTPSDAATCEKGVVKLTDKATDNQKITVTATAKDGTGKSATCELTAKVAKKKLADVEAITVDEQTLSISSAETSGSPAPGSPKGETRKVSELITPDSFKYKAEPADEKEKADAAQDVNLKLINGEGIVSVENNTVTALREGVATLQAVWKYGDAKSNEFKVTVTHSEYQDYAFGSKTAANGNTVESGAYVGGNSGYERLDGNFDIEYDFTNKSADSTQNYFTFALVLADGSGKVARFRADSWITAESNLLAGLAPATIVAYNSTAWTVNTVTDWATWMGDMASEKGASVKVRLTRKNNVLYITYDIENGKYKHAAVAPLVDGVGPTLYVSLSGEYCTCSDIKVYPATQDVQLGTGASQDVKVSDILPIDVTEDTRIEIEQDEASKEIVEATSGADKVTFKGLKNGTATVDVKVNGLSFKCAVTVSDIAVSAIELSEKEVTLKKGDTKKLAAAIKPEGAANQTVTWTSSDPKVATVADDGTITAVAAGTTTITAAIGAVSATCAVTVTDETAAPGETDTPGGSSTGSVVAVEVESVSLNTTATELEVGADTTLTATVKPDNATNKEVIWSTSDAKIETVDEKGKVTAVAAGTATITATSKSNEKATAACVVTVKAPASSDNNNNDNDVTDSDGNDSGNNDSNNGNNGGNSGNNQTDDAKKLVSTTTTVTNSGVKETVKTNEEGTASVTKVKSSKKSVTVSSSVEVKGVKYKVTVIAANAFKSCKNATKITLPATVKKFNKKAFTGAKKIKTIVVKSKKAVTVKKGAFKGVNTKKITIKAGKMSKKQLKKFKKALKKAGFKGKVKK